MNTIHQFPKRALNKLAKMNVDTVSGQVMGGGTPFLGPLMIMNIITIKRR